MTLYLKYRPQKIAELDLGQVRDAVGQITKERVNHGMPHAFLFSGPRGTGKTSAARILAKAINCPYFAEASKGKARGEPCGECEMCQEIAAGTSFDVVEVDAASNRGIDEIRELREKVKLAPMRAQYKVYIIDEVHMLTTEAANALLKTLEEPPAHVVFVLCTTEPEKLPVTVVSRCTRVKFGLPTLGEIEEKLEKVVHSEGVKLGKDDIKLIAGAARGSFRDAIKILEQVIMAEGDTKTVLGVVSGVEPEMFLEIVARGDTKSGLEMVEKLVTGGGNVRGFVERCVELVRERLMAEASEGRNVESDIKLIEGLEKAYERSKTSAVAQLPLEIFVIENRIGEERIARTEKKEIHQAEPVRTAKQTGQGKYKLEDVVGKWGDIMKLVKPKNHSVEALLRSTRPVGFDGEKLELEVFYKFHKDKLESDKCRQIVEGAVTDVFGINPVRLYLRLGEKPVLKSDDVSGKVDDDIVRAAEEIFKAEAI